jgi:hypothetical protein
LEVKVVISFLLFLMLKSEHSMAAPTNNFNDVEIKNQSSPNFNAEDQSLVEAFLNEVEEAKYFSSVLPAQSTHLKTITINTKSRSQYYEGKISIQTACKDGRRLPSLQYLPVMLHEYAHTLFEVNLEHFLLTEKNESAHYEEKFDDGEKSVNYNVPIGIVDLAAPYNEFFADVFAVLTLDDPKAMSDFFLACNELKNHRDFSYDYILDPTKKPIDLVSVFTDIHLPLDPARTFLWQRYIELGPRPDAKRLIFNAVFMASVETVADLYHSKTLYKDWSKMDLVKMNKNFIARINAHLP